MKWIRCSIAAGMITAAASCTVHVAGPAPEPVPAGYATVDYDPVYYDRGWYDGDVWFWHGRDGRVYHERREAREHHYDHHYR